MWTDYKGKPASNSRANEKLHGTQNKRKKIQTINIAGKMPEKIPIACLGALTSVRVAELCCVYWLLNYLMYKHRHNKIYKYIYP